MKILSFDSSTVTATAALTEDAALLAAYTLHTTNTHSETLLPMGEEILRRAKIVLDDVALMAVTVGPGSFTGIRIGVSVVKGLAFGRNIPCVGVSTVEALAENVRELMLPGELCVPVIDARRKQFYSALFEKQSDGSLRRLTDDRLIVTDQLVEELTALANGRRIHACGDGYTAFLAAAKAAGLRCAETPAILRYPSAYAVAQCALRLYESAEDKSIFTDSALNPVYLRATQAERERIGRETGADPESL